MSEKTLILVTLFPDLRDEVKEHNGEDSSLIHSQQMEIGGVQQPLIILYQTVLHAQNDGWKLLAPPKRFKDSDGTFKYQWWLTKNPPKSHCNFLCPLDRRNNE